MCIEAYYGSKMVICQENLLIMKAVFMFLVEPYTNPALIMLLKSTSVDGKDHNGKEAGEITFLKSVEDQNKAMELIKQEKSMHQVVLS